MSFTHFSLSLFQLSLSPCELEKWVHTEQNWYLFSILPSSPNENHLKKHYIKSDDMTPKCFAKKRWQWLSPLSLCFSSSSLPSRWISLAPCFVLMTNVIVIITIPWSFKLVVLMSLLHLILAARHFFANFHHRLQRELLISLTSAWYSSPALSRSIHAWTYEDEVWKQHHNHKFLVSLWTSDCR